jgi:hypothetical protein
MKNGLAAVTVIYNVVNPRWRLVSRKISALFNHPHSQKPVFFQLPNWKSLLQPA